MRALNIFLLLLVSSIAATEVEDESDDNPIIISSDHMDYETNTILVRAGKKLMVSCVFSREDIADKSDLTWRKSGGRIIDGESSPSVFTVEVLEHHTHHKKTSLHFTAIHERDDGKYECSARTLGGQQLTKEVIIRVLGEIKWFDPSEHVGALEGEPLIIDCNVKSTQEIEPQIEITNGFGEPLDESIFTIAGSEITVQSLPRSLDKTIVSCVHIEMFNADRIDDFPVVDRKDVQIGVYYKPEFASETTTRYTITDGKKRDAVLHCNVSSSNPPVKHFAFYVDGKELTDPSKYDLTKDVGRHQGAHLKIYNVGREDLNTYTCEASNGKAKATHDIFLKEANPPFEPRVALMDVKKHSIVWKVETDSNDEASLPIQKLEIRYIRDGVVDDRLGHEHEDSDIDDAFWNAHGGKINRNIASDNIYEVGGLRQAAGYVWRFRQLSEAGFGESVIIRASTQDENTDKMVYDSSSTTSSFVVAFLTGLLALLF